eukprot:GFYU01000886.1.p1 GENE.GFYU01000886.1~~GFYU01000886.1.p1  ORF type:complete len:395 (+),score=77.36 GFYU01000886.1:801-1985(+)
MSSYWTAIFSTLAAPDDDDDGWGVGESAVPSPVRHVSWKARRELHAGSLKRGAHRRSRHTPKITYGVMTFDEPYALPAYPVTHDYGSDSTSHPGVGHGKDSDDDTEPEAVDEYDGTDGENSGAVAGLVHRLGTLSMAHLRPQGVDGSIDTHTGDSPTEGAAATAGSSSGAGSGDECGLDTRLKASARENTLGPLYSLSSWLWALWNSQDDESETEIRQTGFQCPICISLLYEPVTTVCGHTFCHGCLVQATASTKQCAVCREHTDIPAHKLKVNLLLRDVVMEKYPNMYKQRARDSHALVHSCPGLASPSSNGRSSASEYDDSDVSSIDEYEEQSWFDSASESEDTNSSVRYSSDDDYMGNEDNNISTLSDSERFEEHYTMYGENAFVDLWTVY